MSAALAIKDGKTKNKAKVTKYGQLVTAPVDYSTPVARTLADIDTAYNFIEPMAGKSIVITDIIITANRQVGANDATVVLYEAGGVGELNATKDILNLEMIKQSQLVLTGLNLLVPSGLFINAKTNDNTVFITIMFYRVPV